MLYLSSVNCNADAQMFSVFLNKPLNLILMIINSIGGETETIGVEPMMVMAEHFDLYIITYSIDQLNFEEGLTTNEIPYYRLFLKLIFTTKNIIYSLLCYLPRHPFF